MSEFLTPFRQQIAHLCQRHSVLRLDAFGSVLREDFAQDSDVDLVAEFDHDQRKDLSSYFAFKSALETLLSRPVDLIELDALPESRLKRLIERQRQPLYATQA